MTHSRQKIVAGNWKMNGTPASARELILALSATSRGRDAGVGADIILFPPSILIPLAAELLQDSPITIGAQNTYPKDSGAFTGEISAPMCKAFGCRYVLVGHSERRQYFAENENFVAQKFHHVKEHGMIPLLCLGETLDQREKNQTEQVVRQQLLAVYNGQPDCFANCVIAYEPLWAIGTGKTATPEQAQEVHQAIRAWVSEINAEDAQRLPLLYGGSVTEKNAKALFAMPDIDGGLVGGASLVAEQFLEIVKCINSY